jgi:hypothetical protein
MHGGSSMIIISGPSAAPYSSASYDFYDNDQLWTTGNPVPVNMGLDRKIYVRAKASAGTPSLQINLVNNGGYFASGGAINMVTLSTTYQTYEFDFTDAYDAGVEGSSCTSGPCSFDFTNVSGVDFLIEPVSGGYNGSVTIDYISVGTDFTPLPKPSGYIDHFSQVTRRSGNGSSPYTITSDNNSNLVITSTSSINPNTWMSYVLYDNPQMGNTNSSVQIDVTSNYKLFIRAKASTGTPTLKVELRDENGILANMGVSNTVTLSTVYQTFTFDFTGAADGGGPGSVCSPTPCQVDFANIDYLRFYVDATTGGYSGSVYIDYVAMVNDITGIQDITEENQIKIYPNPASENVFINFAEIKDVQSISVYNALGKKIKESIIQASPYELNLDELNKGIYFVILKDSKGLQLIKKLIKN